MSAGATFLWNLQEVTRCFRRDGTDQGSGGTSESTCALQAASHEEKAHSIQEGAQRVMKTVDWLRKHRFMPPAQLKEWHHMVSGGPS